MTRIHRCAGRRLVPILAFLALLPACSLPPERFAPLLESIVDPAEMRIRFVEPALPIRRPQYFSDPPRKRASPGGSSQPDITQRLYEVILASRQPDISWIVAMRPMGAPQRTAIETAPANVTGFMPWFCGATSDYRLVPGKEPRTPDSPEFHPHCYSLGSFPAMIRTRRQINVLFLGSFFGFLEPIL